MSDQKVWKAEEVEDLLRERYSPPEWAFLPQVRSGTGYEAGVRTADALAMGLWPSRGLDLHGFEIKVSRNDWLNELKRPSKAEKIARFCDFWWVVGPREVFLEEEIPSNWGLMVPGAGKLKIIKPAVLLVSCPINKRFLASILRQAQEAIAPDAKLDKAFKAGVAMGKQDCLSEKEIYLFENRRLLAIINEFEAQSGIRIDKYNCGSIGEAVKMVLKGEHKRQKENLSRLLQTAKEIVADIEKDLAEGQKEK